MPAVGAAAPSATAAAAGQARAAAGRTPGAPGARDPGAADPRLEMSRQMRREGGRESVTVGRGGWRAGERWGGQEFTNERTWGEGREGHGKKAEEEVGKGERAEGQGGERGGRRGRRSALARPSPGLARQIPERRRRRRRRSGPRSSRSASGGGEAREGGARRGCGEGRLFHQRKEDWLQPKPVRMQTRALASVGWGAGGRGERLRG